MTSTAVLREIEPDFGYVYRNMELTSLYSNLEANIIQT